MNKKIFVLQNIILGTIAAVIGIVLGFVNSSFLFGLAIVVASIITTFTCSVASMLLIKNSREVAVKSLPDAYEDIIVIEDENKYTGIISLLILTMGIVIRSALFFIIFISYNVENIFLALAISFGVTVMTVMITEGLYIFIVCLFARHMWLIGQEEIAIFSLGGGATKCRISDIDQIETRKYQNKGHMDTYLVLYLNNGNNYTYWGMYAPRNIDRAVVFLEEKILARRNLFAENPVQSAVLDKVAEPVATALNVNSNIVYTNINDLNWQKASRKDKREITYDALLSLIVGSTLWGIIVVSFTRDFLNDPNMLYYVIGVLSLVTLFFIGCIINYISACREKVYSIDALAFKAYANVKSEYRISAYYIDIRTDDGRYAKGIYCESEDYLKIKEETQRVRIVKRCKGNKCDIFLYKYL